MNTDKIASAIIQAALDWNEGDKYNPYPKNSDLYEAYENKWVDLYLEELSIEQSQEQ